MLSLLRKNRQPGVFQKMAPPVVLGLARGRTLCASGLSPIVGGGPGGGARTGTPPGRGQSHGEGHRKNAEP